jgi:hypothetical protein
MSPTSREKRGTLRLQPFVVRCRLSWTNGKASAYITDLSDRGARLSLQDEPPAAGMRVVIDVRFRSEQRHGRLHGEVKWRRTLEPAGGYCVGVRFANLGVEERALLDRVVAGFRSQAARIG